MSGSSASLTATVESGGVAVRPLLRLLRPHHWVKNTLVFAPLVFSLTITRASIQHGLLAFVAFSLMASAIYILNDLRDARTDLMHPEKRRRPIASGEVSVPIALTCFGVLIAASLWVSQLLSTPFLVMLGSYLALNVAYSFWLKQQVIIDVMVIAIGFVLRILAGGAAMEITISHWIVLCTFFAALFLAFGKRKHENLILQEQSAGHRTSLLSYTPDFLNQLLGLTSAMTIMSYALYTIDDHTIAHFGTDRLYVTLPFVVYGIFRYFQLMYNESLGGDPTKHVTGDWPLLAASLLWAATFLVVVQVG